MKRDLMARSEPKQIKSHNHALKSSLLRRELMPVIDFLSWLSKLDTPQASRSYADDYWTELSFLRRM